ncbi:hypothetical protein DEAC_c02520 [Desulfosporosinus acididurans]|uniref:Uncharacterized protein n=1 Tax=Desulfosporosinus acididurans TaxID=476652 RepID=A0A0J1FWS5_9FIRM|nr:hypothetical protein DEAC_c02520 [Desulfosporosinus acididurans]
MMEDNKRFVISILLITMIIIFVVIDKGIVIASTTAVGILNYWFKSNYRNR